MKKNMILAGALLAAAISVAGARAALAESNGSDNEATETQSLLGAKVTAVQAAQAAEAKAGGKTASVSFEDGNGAPFYKVEIVMPDGAQQELAVDAASGEVMKVAAEDNERSDRNGDENGQNEGGENGQHEGGENGENGQK
jgi:uncharacterized membrane protein YkoI